MRRADRLFQIVELLRRKPVRTAQELADALEVSVRTIYRDMDDLAASGLPLRSEAGVGYALDKGYDLPPLMFSRAELEAMEVAGRLLAATVDAGLQEAVESALAKIRAVLPHTLQRPREALPIFAPDFILSDAMRAAMPTVREALQAKRKLRLHYRKEDGSESRRVLRPLALVFWGKVWTLTAWCELRDDFRHFRLDRMQGWELLDDTFDDEPGKTYRDFLKLMEAQYG